MFLTFSIKISNLEIRNLCAALLWLYVGDQVAKVDGIC